MEVNVYNIKGEDTGRKVTLNESIFGIEPNDHAIYLDVKQFMANQRQGTHKSKERSEISGSTRKIGRQKGGGGARRGDMNSPVLVGGGRVFGQKLNVSEDVLLEGEIECPNCGELLEFDFSDIFDGEECDPADCEGCGSNCNSSEE